MRSRTPAGNAPEQEEVHGHAAPAPASPLQNLLDLQRQVGNRAVSGMLANVQRASPASSISTLSPPPSDMDLDEPPPGLEPARPAEQSAQDRQREFGAVVAGHGAFNENHLDPEAPNSRRKAATFTVPDGMEVIMYAPPGAYFDDRPANRVEQLTSLSADDLEMKHSDSNQVQPLPPGYPRTYRAGEQVINYTVQKPDGLNVESTSITVDRPTTLSALVASAAQAGHTKVHYACCGSGLTDNARFRDLFTHRGWYVRFKDPSA